MTSIACPSCNASVELKSSLSVTAICPYCQTLLVRHDKDFTMQGKVALLPDDNSPFTLGTEGRYQNSSFTIIGRIRLKWDDGAWNEWHLLTDEGKSAWLTEAQGYVGITFLSPIKPEKVFMRPLKLGDRYEFKDPILIPPNSSLFQIVDIKKSLIVSAEGELPSLLKSDLPIYEADCLSHDGYFASISCNNHLIGEEIYLGRYLEFDQFQFSRLRDLPGWKRSRSRAEIRPEEQSVP